jgi:SAM-dependent methyltransferase
MPGTADWISFWDSRHSIYVNARHRDVHYRTVAEGIRRHIPVGARVLDYGCGEALHADLAAEPARRVALCEAAPNLRAGLVQSFCDHPKIEVRAPEEIASLPPGSFDVVVMHSVAQYLTPDELDTLLSLFHRLLGNGGQLILGDIIPCHVGAVTDAIALLRFAATNGFFSSAVIGLLRTLASDYWRLRSQLGLARYAEATMIEKLAAAGFKAQRAASNIGHNQARMTFLAHRR